VTFEKELDNEYANNSNTWEQGTEAPQVTLWLSVASPKRTGDWMTYNKYPIKSQMGPLDGVSTLYNLNEEF